MRQTTTTARVAAAVAALTVARVAELHEDPARADREAAARTEVAARRPEDPLHVPAAFAGLYVATMTNP